MKVIIVVNAFKIVLKYISTNITIYYVIIVFKNILMFIFNEVFRIPTLLFFKLNDFFIANLFSVIWA